MKRLFFYLLVAAPLMTIAAKNQKNTTLRHPAIRRIATAKAQKPSQGDISSPVYWAHDPRLMRTAYIAPDSASAARYGLTGPGQRAYHYSGQPVPVDSL